MAIGALRHATRQPTAAWTAYLVLSSALGHLGRLEEAQVSIEHVLAIKPDLNMGHLKEIFPFGEKNYFKIVLDGLKSTNFHF